ncbi:magnesium and cobalt transport protein CorA [Novosphingobium umbonatum]|uniref:Magnesium and cobalt transport protein CorA n=1 Tax=Novosphingobium umbonatum TaxID=1908524 RepID=A0A3S2V9Q0_9SPHN|nr:magnesium and cobalt transport protein CorA [Novosphingobium umbonatum]RVU02155.1 magnesium and cobalt transport protein CorA [Novosphingobium umbonatum]
MTVIASYHYRNGRRIEPIALDTPVQCPIDRSDFVWIGLFEPTEEELRKLQINFDLHPLAIEDALKAHQLPKVDVYGDQLFVVARTAHLEDDKIAYGETAIFVGANHIISVRHGSERAHSALREQLEAAPHLLEHGVDYVLHAILDFIVDGYFPIVEAIEENVLTMEHRALDAFLERDEVTRLFTLRRELMRFQRLLGPMADLCAKLEHMELPYLDPEVRPYFRDVLDHVRRIDGMVGSLRDVLTTVFEVSHLFEQQRQGVITRQLAAWAAILAVPTAIAGIYGMNFENMPELKTRYGYFIVLVVIATICAILYRRFKTARWI